MRYFALAIALLVVGCSGRNAEKFNEEGRAALERKDHAAAVTAFAKVVELKPDDAAGHYNLGIAYVRMRHFDMAEIQFREALRLKPNDVDSSRALTLTRRQIEYRAQP